jgi:excisionase family DNA binding protein
MPETILITVNDTCKELCLGRTKVYELISSGMLKTVQIGNARRVVRESLAKLIENLGKEGA